MRYEYLKAEDPELYIPFMKELERQRSHLELIASENFTSLAVMDAMGSHLTNKYAEGYPGHRYYGGCEYVDEVENIAIERAKNLFGANYANVQPIPDRRQIWRFMPLCCSQATRSWEWL